MCAICQHFGIDRNILYEGGGEDGGLIVVSGHDFPLVLGGIGRNGEVEFNEDVLESFETGIDVAFFDPFVSVRQCPENSNDAIDAIVKRLMRQTTKGWKKSIELAHHTTKSNGEVTDANSRGASSFRDGVRATRYLNPMSESEAHRFKLDDPAPYFRVNQGKANYSARSSVTQQWYKHVSVLLPNGDDVGVVVRWTPPNERLDDEQIQRIRELTAGGDYRSDVKTGDAWIGNVVADVLDLDVENDVDREHIKGMVHKLFENGALKKVPRYNKKTRNMALFVEAAEKSHP